MRVMSIGILYETLINTGSQLPLNIYAWILSICDFCSSAACEGKQIEPTYPLEGRQRLQ